MTVFLPLFDCSGSSLTVNVDPHDLNDVQAVSPRVVLGILSTFVLGRSVFSYQFTDCGGIPSKL